SVRQSAGQPSFQLRAELAMCQPVAIPLLPPFGFQTSTTIFRATPALQCFLRYVKRLERWPAQVLLGQLDFVRAERRSMRLGGVLFVRTAPGDVRADDDERGPIRHTLGRRDRGIDPLQVIGVGDPLYMPAVGLEPFGCVVRK